MWKNWIPLPASLNLYFADDPHRIGMIRHLLTS
jgi:hypothetical protein